MVEGLQGNPSVAATLLQGKSQGKQPVACTAIGPLGQSPPEAQQGNQLVGSTLPGLQAIDTLKAVA